MIVISHRGYWLEESERNSCVAFDRSFKLGFGTETDLRDLNGQIVISHDMPTLDACTLDGFLDKYALQSGGSMPLALNIKSDGLANVLKKKLSTYSKLDAFVFDMSVPDMRGYIDAGIPYFTRMSEVERVPVWCEQAAGIWLDSFGDIWYDRSLIEKLLSSGKRVCVVSPELHKRKFIHLWEMLSSFADAANLILCTDKPELAKTFFKL
jgi:hypothetical protein